MADKSKSVAQNRKAYHDYFVDETYEAGISLFGTEIKSIRCGQVNMKDSYCSFKDGEIFALGIHISPYEKGNIFNREPRRDRKLLMHKKEIIKLSSYVAQKGYTVIPLSMYFKGDRIKVEIVLCLVKNLYDKR
ncbi:MAG: SsrA-binding protein SmpB [Clostridia bacterium]|nr:SsrA-binding protein SmpB [Clostridia bacterium]